MKYRCELCARFGLAGGGDTPGAYAQHMLQAHGEASIAPAKIAAARQSRQASALRFSDGGGSGLRRGKRRRVDV